TQPQGHKVEPVFDLRILPPGLNPSLTEHVNGRLLARIPFCGPVRVAEVDPTRDTGKFMLPHHDHPVTEAGERLVFPQQRAETDEMPLAGGLGSDERRSAAPEIPSPNHQGPWIVY